MREADAGCLFVYGLLRPGQSGFLELGLGSQTQVLGSAAIAGTLYDLGAYPGLILGGDRIVHGEILRLHDPDLLAMIDLYEGFDPYAPVTSEYRRVIWSLRLSTGAIACHVYEFARSPGSAPIIPSGDWLRR
jgi:gamma-glutamylcyclotransferase (GGCT)/AIG2-like uncharacterized protein YtfP